MNRIERQFLMTIRLVAIILLLGLMAGCAAEKKQRIIWPPPPWTPKLEFIGVYSHESDLDNSFLSRLAHQAGGQDTPLFDTPFAVAADGSGKLYVTDPVQARIELVDIQAAKNATFLGYPVLEHPLGIDLDRDGNVYVVDDKKKLVLVFSHDGKPVGRIGSGLLAKPSFVRIDRGTGQIHVSDKGKHAIFVFNPDGSLVRQIGSIGSGHGRFGFPQGMAFDGAGRMYVADMLLSRVQVFSPEGEYLFAFGRQGADPWDFENPRDLAITSDRQLYVVDFRKGLLKSFSLDGELSMIVGGSERTSSILGFSTPSSIYIDPEDRIFIVDRLNQRVSVWQHLSAAYLKNHPLKEEDLAPLRNAARTKSK